MAQTKSIRSLESPKQISEAASKSTKRKSGRGSQPVSQRHTKKTKTEARNIRGQPEAQGTHRDINDAPTAPLAVLVFGDGENGELGLGPTIDSSLSPRLNPFLDPVEPSKYHVVQIACGGMHTIASTSDNKILTWGVNDSGALGRDTEWAGGLRDLDTDSADTDGELNPRESTPGEVPLKHFPARFRVAQVAAGDNCSFVLTTTGMVYGWGTFRDSQGKELFGHSADGAEIEKQPRPTLIDGVRDIIQIACGINHVLALDIVGNIWGWGCNDENQLGRRLFGRTQDSFVPRQIRVCRGKAVYIASGEFHSFALDKGGNVWGWGRNSNGEAGYSGSKAGSNEPQYPGKIASLCGQQVKQLAGGSNHSCAVTSDGRCFVWGRMDSGQLGIQFTAAQLENKVLFRRDIRDRPQVCMQPTLVPGVGSVIHAACGTDHTLFVNRDGHVYATGFNSDGQLGLGSSEDVVDVARRITRRSVVDRKLTWADAGGRFSMIGDKTA